MHTPSVRPSYFSHEQSTDKLKIGRRADALRPGMRPERSGPAEAVYSGAEAARYSGSARMATTQRHLAERALHLLALPPGRLLLDIGCGSGYSGAALEREGHAWIGVDISTEMLRAARAANRPRDLLAMDVGQRLAFRRGMFDGAVSISAVQWLCFATKAGHDPEKRVRQFFRGLHAVLAPGARAALQLYPEQPGHMSMMREAALAAGFSGGLHVDYPRSERSKKLFLVITSSARPRPPPAAAQPVQRARKGKPERPIGKKGKGRRARR